jgi:hypothetical protein
MGGAESGSKNRAKTAEMRRASLARAQSSNTIMTLWKDDLMKLLE